MGISYFNQSLPFGFNCIINNNIIVSELPLFSFSSENDKKLLQGIHGMTMPGGWWLTFRF
jgi:hypothetical protein